MKHMRRHVILSAAKYLVFFVAAALVIPSTFAALSAGSARDLHAQASRPAPKTAQEVVDRFRAAIGRDARDKKPFRMVMSMAMPGGSVLGSDARIETYMSPPERIYMKTMIPGGMGSMEAGFDGTTGWTISDMTGPMILPQEQAMELRKNANPQYDLIADDSLTLRGEATIDGRRVWVVDGKGPDSATFTQYFDDESALLVGLDAGNYGVVPGKPMLQFRDYKRFGTVLIATLMVSRMPTGDSLITRVVEFDQRPIPDSVFAMPAAVKARLPKPPADERISWRS